MENETPEEEPELIIDEDWKTRVQREKEELKAKQEQDAAVDSDADKVDAGTDKPVPQASDDSNEGANEEIPPPPPASLTFLVTSLATQAMAAMGQIPDDDGNPIPVNLDYARHFIDLLGVLEEKTKGNLDAQEEKFLGETLHQMRMLFVSQQSGS